MRSLQYTAAYNQQLERIRSESLPEQLAFLCLAGFILTQAYAVPPIALPVNWALWPSLPDIFGIGMLFFVFTSRLPMRAGEVGRVVLKRLLVLVLFQIILTVLTLPLVPPESIKYPVFSVLLWLKYFLVFWAAVRIPLDKRRMLVLHRMALLAFLWLTLTSLAAYFGVLDLRRFVAHLPPELSGKWGATMLASTAWNTPGTSSIVVLLLAGLTLTTIDYRKNVPLVILVLLLGAVMVFLSGSRQGVIRFATFILILLSRGARKHLIGLVVFLLVTLLLIEIWGGLRVSPTSQIEWALFRQRVFLEDLFSDEAMAGRPTLMRYALQVLNENPVSYIVGHRIGSFLTGYTTPEGIVLAPHNMVLSLLLSGGIFALLIYALSYGSIFVSLWRNREHAWSMVAVTGGMLTSTMTSGIWEAGLATGWYLGLFFVCLHIATTISPSPPPSPRKAG